MNIFENSIYIYMVITLFAYLAGVYINRKTGTSIANPLLISVIIVIVILKITKCDYQLYKRNTEVLTYLLTPTTICLAIPLYEKLELLRKQYKAILFCV